MKPEIVKKLNNLTTEFYQTVASSFDSTRQHPWIGWEKTWGYLVASHSQFLTTKQNASINYIGIDSSKELLEKAHGRFSSNIFLQHDVIDQQTGSIQTLPTTISTQKYDLIVLFGVLHHIPGFNNRLELFKHLQSHLNANGVIVVSVWNFATDSRLKQKILPWSTISMDNEDVEINDFLLPWDREVHAVRYTHYTSTEEMLRLIEDSNLQMTSSFTADGKSEELNSYYILKTKSKTD
jgi:2-polyprenyl-3-methyl-5-hydroxy-6-metoxy-1,4-benzoquinol methylase